MLINVEQDNAALRARNAELEAENAILANELASIREYEEEMEVESTGSAESEGESSDLTVRSMDEADEEAGSEGQPSSSDGGLAEALEETLRGTAEDVTPEPPSSDGA